MAYSLRAPTALLRVTSDQQGRLAISGQPVGDGAIVPPDTSPGVRKVTVLTPPAPRIFLALDETVEAAGLNRTGYKWAPMPPSTRIVFHLTPEQALYGSVEQGGGLASFGVIIEYFGE